NFYLIFYCLILKGILMPVLISVSHIDLVLFCFCFVSVHRYLLETEHQNPSVEKSGGKGPSRSHANG
ncbi:MAG: hypothetical protein ACKVOY_15155, partial [Burkholderiaceae bacterium]